MILQLLVTLNKKTEAAATALAIVEVVLKQILSSFGRSACSEQCTAAAAAKDDDNDDVVVDNDDDDDDDDDDDCAIYITFR